LFTLTRQKLNLEKTEMCSQATLDLIKSVVDEKVNRDEMFTAFDVSVEVQERAKTAGIPTERHREMKRFIHDEITVYLSSGLYEKTLKDVGAPEKAFVYFPVNGDPDNYQPRDRGNKTPAPTMALPASIPMPQVVTAPGDKVLSPDARGSVSVPRGMTRALNFASGEEVVVVADQHNGQPCLVISRMVDKDANQAILTQYTVNPNRNLRVTVKALRKLPPGTQVRAFAKGSRCYLVNN